MKLLKKTAAAALCAALTLTSVPVFAAETASQTPDVKVQLNGKNVEFTDAAPVIKEGRTYVPFRAVFEALDVDSIEFDDATKTIIAEDDGTTVKFTIGKTEMELTKDGTTTTQTLDAAAFIKNSRTYVPVRFAAQALDCKVGWDGDFKTVVILDKEKLTEDLDGQFTLMNKYSETAAKVTKENPAFTGTLNLKLNMDNDGTPLVVAGSCDIKGKVDETEAIMNSAVKLDLNDLRKQLQAEEAIDDETEKVITSAENFNFDMVMDMNSGMFYLSSSLLNTVFGTEDGTWYSLNFSELMAQGGMNFNFSDLMNLSTQGASYENVVDELIDAADINNSYAVQAMASSVDMLKNMYADSAFKKDGSSYVSNYSYTESGITTTCKTTLKADANDNIYGCKVEMTMKMAGSEIMTITADYENLDCAMDMYMNMMGAMELKMDGSFKYQKTVDGLNTPGKNSKFQSLEEILF